MREYLFRGKRKDNGEWVEGSLVAKVDPLLETSYYFILAQGRGESFVTWHMVDPATVGQFTGLMDKNGKRIFEGDIVRIYKTLFVTEWRGAEFVFGHINGQPWSYPYFASHAESCEVIGTIHDNPELLKEETT